MKQRIETQQQLALAIAAECHKAPQRLKARERLAQYGYEPELGFFRDCPLYSDRQVDLMVRLIELDELAKETEARLKGYPRGVLTGITP